METTTNALSNVGLYGLAIMGQNFALNMASHGFRVSVCNRSPDKIDVTVNRAIHEGNLPLVGFHSPRDFVASIERPRTIILLVMAGKPVDDTIEMFANLLDPDDLIVDGGNEWYPNSVKRANIMQSHIRGPFLFMGMGISGGEEGARNGPSLMPGGSRIAYERVLPILSKCAAQVEGEACVCYLGGVGSGNYVKMVHNGIEYGDMQLIAEIYHIMTASGMSQDCMSRTFSDWNTTSLSSYLIEITAIILSKRDDQSDDYVLNVIKDKSGMKGTGKWTVLDAAERAVAIPTISSSLDARLLSSLRDQRQLAARPTTGSAIDPRDLFQALYCAKIVSYAQGLSLIASASSSSVDWSCSLVDCCRIWRGGCIIRARPLLDKIGQAFHNNPSLPNLLLDPQLSQEMLDYESGWRRCVMHAINSKVPCPALSASLAYYDSMHCGRLPANLIQAQRDFFGGHSFERLDKPGDFHLAWTASHHDIGDISQRKAGNI